MRLKPSWIAVIASLTAVALVFAGLCLGLMLAKHSEEKEKGKEYVAETADLVPAIVVEAHGDPATFEKLKEHIERLSIAEGISMRAAADAVLAGHRWGISDGDVDRVVKFAAAGVIANAPRMLASIATLKEQAGMETEQVLGLVGALGKTAEDQTALADAMAKNVQLAKLVGLTPEQFGRRVAAVAAHEHEGVEEALETVKGWAEYKYEQEHPGDSPDE